MKRQGIVEQIDGAVELGGVLYIVEMKWRDKPIGQAGNCAASRQRLRAGNVGGIFISYSGFSPAAIDDAKTGLTQKAFVLAELQEIIQMVDREADLKAFFKEKLNRARTDRNPFYKVAI